MAGGRYGRRDHRKRVEEVLPIRITDATKRGAVKANPSGSVPGGLSVQWDGQTIPIQLTTTRQRLGGRRIWYLCPQCGRRKGVLYLVPNSSRPLGCRVCHQLVYRSTTLSRPDRLYLRSDRFYAKLGTTRGAVYAGQFWRKPKHMRYTTFRRILDRAERCADAALMGSAFVRSVIIPNLIRR